MSRKVEIEMTVDDAKAVRAWQRAKDNIAEFDKQGKKTSKTFGSMVTDQVKGIASIAAGFAGVGSVIGGIVTAAQLVRAEYDNLLLRRSKAADAQLTLSGAERQLALNVGGDPFAPLAVKLAQQQKAIQIRDQIVTQSGGTPLEVTNALSGAFSARGNASLEQAGAAVGAAVQLAPTSEDIDYLAAGSLDLSRSGADPKNAAAFLAAAGSQLRLTKTKEVGENTAKAVNLLGQFGNDERESAALFGLLTKAGTDPEGRSSVTAGLQFAGQVRKLAPDAGNTFAGLEQIANDPALKAEFLKNLAGEQRFRPTFESLVTNPETRAELFGIRDSLPSFADSARLMGEQSQLLKSLPTASVRDVDRGMVSTTESILAGDTTGISGVLDKRIPDLQTAIGTGATAKRITGILRAVQSNLGEDPVAALDVAQSQLTAESNRLRRGRPGMPATSIRTGDFVVRTPATPAVPATVREVFIADKLDKLIEVLLEARQTTADRVAGQNAPAPQINLNLNNRPANADTRISPPSGSRPHSRLNATPPGGRN